MAHQPETVTFSSLPSPRGPTEHDDRESSNPSEQDPTELLRLVSTSEGSVHTPDCNPKPFCAWVDSLWLFEAVAWVISAAAMASIGLVLWVYENRPLPDWPFDGLSINAFVSALSMVSKTTLMVPLTSSIGQLKWLWVRRERPLADLQIFDEASRGPLGALKLLYRTKGVHLVSLGAIITVCALAIDTFIQQSLKLEDVFNVALAQSYGGENSYEDYGVAHFPPKMKSTIPNSMKMTSSSATNAILEAPMQHNGVATKAFHPPGTYIKVRWWWLALPVALQAMTLVLLVITFARSRLRKLENWKSSSLAVSRSGVLSEGDFGMAEVGRQYEIDGIANQVKICSRYTSTGHTVEHSSPD